MEATLYSLVSVLIVSVISLIGALTLAWKQDTVRKWISVFVALAIGALFGDVLLHILPELYETELANIVPWGVFLGIIIFFILEKFLHWRHTHGEHEECEDSLNTHDHTAIKPIGPLVLGADALHNFIDGMIIAAAYLISPAVGLATTLAVILHEIPQEIADFGVLIHSGYSRGKALFYNFLSALVAIFGAVIVLLLGFSASVETIVLSIAAGGFIYIAGSDLVPELHGQKGKGGTVLQIIAIVFGFVIMALLTFLE